MTQIGSLLAVATVLLTYGLHFIVREGGLIRETKGYLCRNKCRGGLMREEGRNRGILRYYFYSMGCMTT